ncbi:VOC family protein [Martelella radicis]|uniref:Catechol 2,3-dioxygenase-like lactoylglutathione lyase family enzyme n=1 Tax=Martelella radicis TaxID=1397476 RepID=A0A7W6KHU0_9HYPH|nr:VOC family protein [Martelella radicis]MBB4121546.1 catechol 2,3-dioxygenase-like lactoylglutathione lyase family enzyme [Martelella radicis]
MAKPVFINTLVFVSDMNRSVDFYCDLLGQTIAQDHGDFVQLENGLALHMGPALEATMFGAPSGERSRYGRGNLVLYFETDELEAIFARMPLKTDLIHPIETQAWGQKVFRCHDPDGHIVEVGEPM